MQTDWVRCETATPPMAVPGQSRRFGFVRFRGHCGHEFLRQGRLGPEADLGRGMLCDAEVRVSNALPPGGASRKVRMRAMLSVRPRSNIRQAPMTKSDELAAYRTFTRGEWAALRSNTPLTLSDS